MPRSKEERKDFVRIGLYDSKMRKIKNSISVLWQKILQVLAETRMYRFSNIALTASQITFGFSLSGFFGIELLSTKLIAINVVLTLVLWYVSLKEKGEIHVYRY